MISRVPFKTVTQDLWGFPFEGVYGDIQPSLLKAYTEIFRVP